jgi:hypothetical protein
MTVTRRNIIDSAESGDRFVQGAVLLNQEMSGLTTAQLNNILTPQVPGFRIFGIDQEVSNSTTTNSVNAAWPTRNETAVGT